MQDFSSKLTAYGFLGILIPGIVVVYCELELLSSDILSESIHSFCCGCQSQIDESPTLFCHTCRIILFINISYAVGIIVNSISSVLFRGLRNNEDALRYTYNKIMYKSRGYYEFENLTVSEPVDINPCSLWTNAICVYLKQILLLTVSFLLPFHRYSEIERNYYAAYYWLDSRDRISTVSTLETQINFVRNMLITVVILSITFRGHIQAEYALVSLIVLMFFFMIVWQNKASERVWEDYHWFKLMERNEKNNNNNH